MKLIICLECGDIFNLTMDRKTCSCGESHGKYVDNLNAEISGNCKAIGFNNDSFVKARHIQKIEDNVNENSKSCCAGVTFEAFFIPEKTNSIKRID